MKKGDKVFVAISGGVDSGVSAALLKRAGFDVTGVFIKVWHPEFSPCNWKEERRDAMRVASALDIPFLTFDFEAEYKQYVIDSMLSEYAAGRTPNPDVMCNKYIKFGSFLREAKKRGADYIATGHYAIAEERKEHSRSLFLLKESRDKEKEQSYFLWTLTQDELEKSLFPVGGLHKSEVRKLARQFSLPVSEKKDSQGLCFLGKIDISEFLKMYLPAKPGALLDTKGEVIGTHEGAHLLTLGERHGFTVLKKGTQDAPLYVVAKDIKNNTVTVSPRSSEMQKYAVTKATLVAVNWNAYTPLSGKTYQARFRYHQEPQDVLVYREDTLVSVTFKKPQYSVSAGQSLVLYDGEYCLGGGVIENVQ